MVGNRLAALGVDAEDVRREVLGDAYPERAQAVALDAMSRDGRSDHRGVGVTVAGWILLRWRTPSSELIAALAQRVEDPLFPGQDAAELLAALAGDARVEFAESVLLALRGALRRESGTATMAALAPARRGDPCVGAAAAEWLTARARSISTCDCWPSSVGMPPGF